ncbi:hypothetical protein Tco_0050924, partial [Tanacetum coccineum]
PPSLDYNPIMGGVTFWGGQDDKRRKRMGRWTNVTWGGGQNKEVTDDHLTKKKLGLSGTFMRKVWDVIALGEAVDTVD